MYGTRVRRRAPPAPGGPLPPTPSAVNVGQGVQYPPPLRLVVNGNASSREGRNDAGSRFTMPEWCALRSHLVGVSGSNPPMGETLGSALGHGGRPISD